MLVVADIKPLQRCQKNTSMSSMSADPPREVPAPAHFAPLSRPPHAGLGPTASAADSRTITAILSALPQEQAGLLALLRRPSRIVHAGRDFWAGDLHGHPVVLGLSKIGKVAAATTAAALIERFGVGRIVFTGVAGGLKKGVNAGDVVVASSFLQHDLDVSPLYPQFEVPFYGRAVFSTDAVMCQHLRAAAQAALADSAARLDFADPGVHHGLIVSGDRFMGAVSGSLALQTMLLTAGHDALAVEMEGAAVAQVCHDYRVPFAAVRTISDRADDGAHLDFQDFVDNVAGDYACRILCHFLNLL